MSKGQDTKKTGAKKKAQKTMKEKRTEKREKKNIQNKGLDL